MLRYRIPRKRLYISLIISTVVLLIWFKITPNADHSNHLERDYVLGDGINGKRDETQKKKNVFPKSNNPVNIFYAPADIARGSERYERTQLRTAKGSTPIFIHSPDMDTMISSHVKQYGTWEEDLLKQMATIISRFRDITFLDIGCNIGVYTLYMADIGVEILAVDPVMDNLRLLSMSVQSGHFNGNTTLIWNAISNEYKNVMVRIPKGNIGGAHVVDSLENVDDVDENEIKEQHMEVSSAESILLDDLVPLVKTKNVAIKMDIEGHEANALQGAGNFFQTFDVKLILMEWVHHRYKDTGQMIVDFLVRNGLFPYENVDMKKFLDPDKFYIWPENVFWIKR